MTTAIATAADFLLAARADAQRAEQAKRDAETLFLAAADAAGLTEIETTAGVRVAIEHRPRRTFDVSVLAENLPVEIVAQVLKEAIDPQAFDNAVGAGLIDATIADKAVTVDYSTQVRVYGEQGVKARRV
jgi:hypothetical protein